MSAHLRNVQQELQHTQAIYDAKHRQIETEEHFKQVADRECGRLSAEIKRMEKEISELTDQLNSVQNSIYRGNERIEKIRAELKMEKDELDEWLRVQTEKEEDTFALLKYTKEDNTRIKELGLAIERLGQEVNRKKAALNNEVTETQVTQIELDKTTEAFRRLHLERQDLILQWEAAIKSMQKRDQEIEELQEKYQFTKDDIVTKQKVVAEKQAFLDQQQKDNEETERKITLCDRNKRREEATAKLAKVTGDTMSLEAKAAEIFIYVRRLDQEALKQQALLYAQEFQIQQLERKGDRSDEEKEVLLKRIDELNAAHEEQSRKFNLLNTQLKKSQEDLRLAKRNLGNLQKEKEGVQENIQELNLYTESAISQLAAKVREKEELTVEELVLRLELRKLRGFLNTRADEVYSLESRQIQLRLALEERAKEISLHNDMLRLQIKNAEDERHSAQAELRDRQARVDRLRRRYEILMTQFAAPEDAAEDATEHSQAYYVIRAAQQREALQREGDELDARIRKAEKEIKALENTLRLMNDRNEEYRMNLYKAELNATDVQHKEMLEQQYAAAMERYKSRRNEIQAHQQSLTALEALLSEASNREAAVRGTSSASESRLAAATRDLREQELRRDRALRHAAAAAKAARNPPRPNTAPVAELDEIDLRVRLLRDLAATLYAEIGRALEPYPDALAASHALFVEYDVPPPSKPASRSVSRTNSRPASLGGTPSPGPSSGRATPTYGAARSSPSLASSAAASPRPPPSPMLDRQTTSSPAPLPLRSPTLRDQSSRRSPAAAATSRINLNAAVVLPPAPSTTSSRGPSPAGVRRTGSSVAASPVRVASAQPSQQPPHQLEPITGAGRVKRPARPGSAGSAGSAASRGSGASR
ncbi:Coiled-coil domain-containing protein 39 [Cladochytrium tenue]|nr:Coiled-coil domain-containing protein 39 [Cladochytrium tenue]